MGNEVCPILSFTIYVVVFAVSPSESKNKIFLEAHYVPDLQNYLIFFYKIYYSCQGGIWC